MQEIADRLEGELRALANPERAEHEKRYLKSDLAFLGASMPQIVRVARGARSLVPTHDALVDLAEALWSVPIHERRMLAVELLDGGSGLLDAGDLGWLERFIGESRTWALVDGLAASVVGALLGRDPEHVASVLDRWSADPDYWVRRASLLAELAPIRLGAAPHRFLARADPLLEEREFFIRKAIGWVLREAAKRHPEDVVAWLGPRTGRASGVTMREAVKYLPADDAERLLGAYRSRRRAG
ncbi:MAG: DNA alkylation repair protein [Candidatus Limnocylindria bacterium]